MLAATSLLLEGYTVAALPYLQGVGITPALEEFLRAVFLRLQHLTPEALRQKSSGELEGLGIVYNAWLRHLATSLLSAERQ